LQVRMSISQSVRRRSGCHNYVRHIQKSTAGFDVLTVG